MGRLVYMDHSPDLCPRDGRKWYLAVKLKGRYGGIVDIQRLSEP